jgi:hypothetical protein
VRDEDLGMFQIIFNAAVDTRHKVTLDFPLKIEMCKTVRLKIRATFHIMK